MKRPSFSSPRKRASSPRERASSPRKDAGSNPRRVLGITLFVIGGALFAIGSACSNQGEGERCEIENNNDDCKTDEGLLCYPEAQLKNAGSDRCCPADRSKATHPICKTSADIGAGDAIAPADTGPSPTPDTGAPDGDAGGEDAPSDADADAGDQ